MNEFMVVVERAVRPVQAGPKKKLRMREELLAHLTSRTRVSEFARHVEPLAHVFREATR